MKFARISAMLLAGCIATLSALPAMAGSLTFDVMGVTASDVTANVLFDYTAIDASNGTLDIKLTNTADATNHPDAVITSFAFNIPSNVTGASSLVTDAGTWNLDLDEDSINTPGNFGDFDLALLTGQNFQGGTPNNSLLDVGEMGTFSFNVTGTNMDTLDELSFLSLFSDPQNNNTQTQYFAVRFQNTEMNGNGSDVAFPTGDPTPPIITQPIPLPAGVWLLGAGLATLFARRARR